MRLRYVITTLLVLSAVIAPCALLHHLTSAHSVAMVHAYRIIANADEHAGQFVVIPAQMLNPALIEAPRYEGGPIWTWRVVELREFAGPGYGYDRFEIHQPLHHGPILGNEDLFWRAPPEQGFVAGTLERTVHGDLTMTGLHFFRTKQQMSVDLRRALERGQHEHC